MEDSRRDQSVADSERVAQDAEFNDESMQDDVDYDIMVELKDVRQQKYF